MKTRIINQIQDEDLPGSLWFDENGKYDVCMIIYEQNRGIYSLVVVQPCQNPANKIGIYKTGHADTEALRLHLGLYPTYKCMGHISDLDIPSFLEELKSAT